MLTPPVATYRIEPRNRFFEAVDAMVGYEIHPGNTVTFFSEVDLTEIERIRGPHGGQRPSYTAFVIKGVAMALQEFPYANRRVCRRIWLPFFGPRLQAFSHSDIAVNVERDLPGSASATFADVLRDADQLSLTEITEWLRALATCDLNSNKQWHDFHWVITSFPRWLCVILLRLACYFPSLWVKYRGAAVLISSPAKYGVDGVIATWTSPLGISFGLVDERPVVRHGKVVACSTFNLILNFDRRVMAGAQAARFFKRIVDILEHAETEMAPFVPRVPDLPTSADAPGSFSPTEQRN